MVDLQGRVLDVEAILEKALELEPDRVAVVPGMHEHMGGERREARRQLPDVEVVDVDHVGVRGERAADLLRVEVRRRRLEQHAPRLAEQPDARVDHEAGDHAARRCASARSKPVVTMTTPAISVPISA